jgi:enolase
MIEADGTIPTKPTWASYCILGVSLAWSKASPRRIVGLSLSLQSVWCQRAHFAPADAEHSQRRQTRGFGRRFAGVHGYAGRCRELLALPADGTEIYHSLKKVLHDRKLSTSVGDEGGFAPNVAGTEDALGVIMKAIEGAGYKPGDDVLLAMDPQ